MTHDRSISGDGPPEVTIASVRFDHRREVLGLGTARPRLSWTVETTAAACHQAAYAIEAYGPEGRHRGQTGRVESDQSMLIPWPFAPLSSRKRLTCHVRV